MTYQQFTQKRINDVLNANAKNLKSVHNDLIKNTNTPLNSLNLFVGKKGSGKTVTAIKEIIKISENSPETHMLIYINKTGTQHDKVFEELKHLIDIPILYCSWQNAVEALENIFEYKKLYDSIKKNNLDNELQPNHFEELKENLYVVDTARPFLHTLIFFEDTAQSPLMKTKLIKSLLAECRHYQVSCFLPVQYWKSLDSFIKENANKIYYFGGFPPKSFHYFLSQVPVQHDHHELLREYQKLSISDIMVVDAYSGDVLFVDREEM